MSIAPPFTSSPNVQPPRGVRIVRRLGVVFAFGGVFNALGVMVGARFLDVPMPDAGWFARCALVTVLALSALAIRPHRLWYAALLALPVVYYVLLPARWVWFVLWVVMCISWYRLLLESRVRRWFSPPF